ncbi:MAG: YhfC family glutamic-type intramembrane protease, partial [Armatimonadetes bacterium]|nr:YhfC family glutamic-type intramembrane protease [Armatimonadota bacterium]
ALKSFEFEVTGGSPPPHFDTQSAVTKPAAILRRLIPGELMILVGLTAVVLCQMMLRTRLRLFGLGALLWTVSVAVKVGLAVLGNKPVSHALHSVLPMFPADFVFWIYIGLLTGITEVGIFLVLTRFFQRRQWTWKDAASVGVGFGAIEAIMVAASIAAAVALGKMPVGGTDISSALVPSLERLIAIVVHTAAAVMIIYAITKGKWGWFWTSFAYKTGIDSVAGYLLLGGNAALGAHPWFVELCLFGPFAYVGLVILFMLKNRWEAAPPPAVPLSASGGSPGS